MILVHTEPVTIQATGTTQNGLPVVLVNGELCVVQELEP